MRLTGGVILPEHGLRRALTIIGLTLAFVFLIVTPWLWGWIKIVGGLF